MNKKQTAVEWLNDQFDSSISLHSSEWQILEQWMKKALAIEKEQIIIAYHNGYSNAIQSDPKEYNPEQYYNEIYITECNECGYLQGWYGDNDLIYNCSICNPKAI